MSTFVKGVAQYFQNFLEILIKVKETIISRIIFQIGAIPKISSEGMVVINVIGMTVLKNILNENENEFRGNRPT